MSEPTDTPTGGLRRREIISGGAAGLGALMLGSVGRLELGVRT